MAGDRAHGARAALPARALFVLPPGDHVLQGAPPPAPAPIAPTTSITVPAGEALDAGIPDECI
jgi:hypothetical protein